MFGFSLPKLVVLGVIIFAIWYVYKIYERKQRILVKEDQDKVKKDTSSVDMISCKNCGDYFVPSNGSIYCDKDTCVVGK
ncbi:MAG: hypothetical protein CMM67_04780 [Rhodospirillaceae bacterium]|nr:hypothetical protein [Rhodospirillaceae bacterium]MAV87542.1 hypothetical protein [Rhodospirillaceae bacterium]OUT79004.1 MAG: hypothetical protein CBB83_04965 [Rhodospirillaceae bacterium TMED23]|tara:strand:+ start:992 stop:1228 length:237 start_codon:yes stop_codon:yes gene_type:complete